MLCLCYAASIGDGPAQAWSGGGRRIVRNRLTTVLRVQVSTSQFASFRDGSVGAWGDGDCGGESRSGRRQLNNVHQ